MDILFIIFLLFAIVAAMIASETDKWGFTTAILITTFTALDLFFNVPIWATIVVNPLTIIMFVFAYVVVGATYTAFWRWPEYLRDHSSDIQERYKAWSAKQTGSAPKQEFMNSYEYRDYTSSHNSDFLVNWVLVWPFSLAWELTRKPAIWLGNTVYDLLGNTFTRIGRHVTNKILRDK